MAVGRRPGQHALAIRPWAVGPAPLIGIKAKAFIVAAIAGHLI